MSCHDARELFSALIDETLTREERADVYGHLATCADCRRELAGIERTVALVRGTTPARAPVGFVDRVVTASRPAPWHVRAARAMLLPWPVKVPLGAAAVLLVAGLAVLMFRGTAEQQRATRHETPPSLGDRSVTAERFQHQRPEQERGAAPERLPGTDPNTRATAQAPPPVPAAPAPTTGGEATSSDRAAPPAEQDRTAGATLSRADDGTKQSAPAERREAPARAKAEALRSAAPSLSAPPDVVARLVAPERSTAERALAALAARLGGAQTGRWADGDALFVELAIPRERYTDFTREVARLGEYRPESEAPSLPETVRVAVRLGA